MKKIIDTLLAITNFFKIPRMPKLFEGGLYSVPDGDGKYSMLKILKLDEEGVHVQLYSNLYDSIPSDVNQKDLFIERNPKKFTGAMHVPLSNKVFKKWRAKLIKIIDISEEELVGYNIWKESKGGYYDGEHF
jgi:hypothetical protein